MSNPGDSIRGENPDLEAFSRLDKAVEEAAGLIEGLRRELALARKQGADMQELLRKFTGGEEDPSRMLARLDTLESQNQDLLDRLRQGKEGVERLLARIRFLEEQG